MTIEDIEKSIITKFRWQIYRNFVKAVEEYQMIDEGDRIAVCISGGKDSFLLAKCLQELQKHGKKKFEIEYINMNPGYSENDILELKKTANSLGIDIQIFNSDVFKVANLQKRGRCYLCSRMRRGFLYGVAEKLKCNKIALGHHFDDVIETILLNVLIGGQYKTMMPKLESDNFKGLELIRPLYLVQEKDIIEWANYTKIKVIDPVCPIVEEKDKESKRAKIKELVADLEKINPNAKKSIFRSAENVKLGAVIEFQKNGKQYNFLDFYKKDVEINIKKRNERKKEERDDEK